jgi:hypothetical protein
MRTDDLSTVDRATLRAWRASNLIGWGAAGVGAFAVAYVLVEGAARIVARLPLGALRVPLGLVLAVTGMLVPPLAAGIVIGDHVYRWPGWTTIAACAIPLVVFLGRAYPSLGLQEWAIVGAFGALIVLVTARVAKVRFESRPRALRAPG